MFWPTRLQNMVPYRCSMRSQLYPCRNLPFLMLLLGMLATSLKLNAYFGSLNLALQQTKQSLGAYTRLWYVVSHRLMLRPYQTILLTYGLTIFHLSSKMG